MNPSVRKPQPDSSPQASTDIHRKTIYTCDPDQPTIFPNPLVQEVQSGAPNFIRHIKEIHVQILKAGYVPDPQDRSNGLWVAILFYLHWIGKRFHDTVAWPVTTIEECGLIQTMMAIVAHHHGNEEHLLALRQLIEQST